ncbi:unnamed protein product [Symbiodinium natans]|uniref:Uncharacterized protein n=1 Tax=Symbiodinium natans TaxID=878477 RepID=A0A812PN69_9DINO|nr:unnamed protein product [Symbiodinium natans]
MRTLAELMEGPSQPGPSNDFGEILLGTNDVSDLGFVALCDALCPGRATLGYLNLTSNRLTSVSVCRMTAVLESWCQAAVDLLPLGGVDVTYNDASIQSVLGFRSALRRLSATRPKDACQHMFTAGCG